MGVIREHRLAVDAGRRGLAERQRGTPGRPAADLELGGTNPFAPVAEYGSASCELGDGPFPHLEFALNHPKGCRR